MIKLPNSTSLLKYYSSHPNSDHRHFRLSHIDFVGRLLASLTLLGATLYALKTMITGDAGTSNGLGIAVAAVLILAPMILIAAKVIAMIVDGDRQDRLENELSTVLRARYGVETVILMSRRRPVVLDTTRSDPAALYQMTLRRWITRFGTKRPLANNQLMCTLGGNREMLIFGCYIIHNDQVYLFDESGIEMSRIDLPRSVRKTYLSTSKLLSLRALLSERTKGSI